MTFKPIHEQKPSLLEERESKLDELACIGAFVNELINIMVRLKPLDDKDFDEDERIEIIGILQNDYKTVNDWYERLKNELNHGNLDQLLNAVTKFIDDEIYFSEIVQMTVKYKTHITEDQLGYVSPEDREAHKREISRLERLIRIIRERIEKKYKQFQTILLADIEKSTEISNAATELNQHPARTPIELAQDNAHRIISSLGGTPIRQAGDTIIGFFNNNESAIIAAVRIIKRICQNEMYRFELPNGNCRHVSYKIGLHKAAIIHRNGVPVYYESDIGYADRLMRLCPRNGQIYCSPSAIEGIDIDQICTGLSLSSIKVLPILGPHSLKGYKELATAYEIVWQ